MFSRLHQHFGTAGMILAIMALVVALAGGAYAASNAGSGDAAASAKAKKGPRGPKGPKGDTGAQGPEGKQGQAGANGKDGTNGTNGDKGANGTSVTSTEFATSEEGHCTEGGSKFVVGAGKTYACNGVKGDQGDPGDPWTAGGTLPEDATETGMWAVTGKYAENAAVAAPISFPIPLSAADVATLNASCGFFECGDVVILAVGEGNTTNCPGTAGAPKAASGKLCIYPTKLEGYAEIIGKKAFVKQSLDGSLGLNESGALVFGTRGSGEGTVEGAGSWALTAP